MLHVSTPSAETRAILTRGLGEEVPIPVLLAADSIMTSTSSPACG